MFLNLTINLDQHCSPFATIPRFFNFICASYKKPISNSVAFYCWCPIFSLFNLLFNYFMCLRKDMADEKKKKAPVSASFLSTTASTHLPAASVSSVLPPNALGQRFLEAIQYKPLEEKHLFGYSISKRALKHLSPTEIRDLVEIFQTFDRDKTGFLKAKSLTYALRVLGFNISEQICQDLIESDSSKSRGFNFNQFLELIIDKQDSSKDHFGEIYTVFKLFDIDNKQNIDIDDLRRAASEANVPLTEKEFNGMISEADQNGDGLVDLNEFIAIMFRTNLY